MDNRPIKDGELLAYLDGERLPHVEQALQASPELRRELESLQRTDAHLRWMFGGVSRPDPQDMVDFATGKATSIQQLRVAAYLRDSPVGREEMKTLEEELGIASRMPAPSRPRRIIASLLPFSLAEGFRSTAEQTELRRFIAADLEILLTIAPPEDELWRITGHVLRSGNAVPEREVILRAGRRRYQQITDASGFFTFAPIGPGRYSLSVLDGKVQVQVQEIILSLTD